MNVARAFGPAVVSGFPNYHWIVSIFSSPQTSPYIAMVQYWIGPGLGSLLASAIYAILKQYVYHFLKTHWIHASIYYRCIPLSAILLPTANAHRHPQL